MVKSLIRLPIVAVVAIFAAVACSAVDNGPDDDSSASNNPDNTASSSGSGMDGGNGGTGGGGAGSSEGGTGGGFDPTSSGGSGGGESCLTTSAEATKKALDIVLVWDRSGSMTGIKWDGTVNAVTQFVNAPSSEGVSVGINFFPIDSAPDQCQPALHNPPQIPLTELPMGATDIVNAINAESPSGLTPTYDALHGTLQYLTAYQDANPDHVVIAVLASDGLPTECNTDTNAIAQLAQSAYIYNGTRTYCVAIQGSSVPDLDQIAAAGGTGQAFDITSNINLFQQAMEDIRASALGCEYPIPEPEMGEVFEPTKMNLIYTPGGNGTEQVLPQADNQYDCGNDPGWYYDDPNNPTQVLLCPASCSLLSGDTEALVQFEFGCPTVVN